MHCVSRGSCYLVNSYCDLQEENQWKKESYEACWLSLVLETRPQYKLTLSETDSVRRESYKQQQVIHFMVERNPSQTLRLGSSTGMTEHQLPLSNTSGSLHTTTKQKAVIQEKVNNGEDKQEVTAITQDVSKPIRVNFRASSLMSSPTETSSRMPRRE
ncbi:hypothetical protein PBY51_018043 [Eleginops maclovinus]|uniref:Telethonin n=1 Tax=Eleginops maclovinus TaxID=56733 RepID=A0AAN8APS3_ELEMC|nr:hypothetical protein PBY51_018043 [Eleginops maclovinus]